jgi:hypothetical protein
MVRPHASIIAYLAFVSAQAHFSFVQRKLGERPLPTTFVQSRCPGRTRVIFAAQLLQNPRWRPERASYSNRPSGFSKRQRVQVFMADPKD